MGVALVVVSYGSAELVAANLPADVVSALGARLVVVDNYSGPAARATARRLADERGWDLLEPAANLGFGAGVNLGAAHAVARGATELVMVNPDLRADAATLAALARAARDEPRTLWSPRVLRADGSTWFEGGEVDVRAGRTRTAGADSTSPTGWLSGACLAVSARLWADCGGFDDDYFLYWEDIDLAWRIRAAGGRLAVRADLTVEHDVGGTQGGKSLVYLRENARNRLLFAAKHLSPRERLRWSATSFGYARQLLRRAGITRRDVRRALPAVRAIAAGTALGTARLLVPPR